jgi:hypothetical protein
MRSTSIASLRVIAKALHIKGELQAWTSPRVGLLANAALLARRA